MIYEIPPSSPSYPVTQVIVVEDNSDAAVYRDRGGVYRDDGRLGLRRVGHRAITIRLTSATAVSTRPTTRSIRPTAIHASYNPWTGAYGRGAVAYGPYGGAGVGARYNPRTGTYARGAAAWGPYGARGAATAL